MKVSLQSKLLLMCTALVLITSLGISSSFYLLTKADKHRESRQRIRIAFDIVLDGLQALQNTYTGRIYEFLNSNARIASTGSMYQQGRKVLQDPQLINAYIAKISMELKDFARLIKANTLALYAIDTRLLLIYQREGQEEIIGGYVLSDTGQDTFLALDDPTSQEMLKIWMKKTPIPENPLPSGVAAVYEGDIPETVVSELFSTRQKLGLKVSAPVTYSGQVVGVLVGEVLFTQELVERYASLSQTAINLFAEDQLNIGTLAEQTQLESEVLDQLTTCDAIVSDEQQELLISARSFAEHDYYQGACALRNAKGRIGAVTISLSQEIEKQAIRKISIAVLGVAGITIAIAVGISVLFSRKAVTFIQQLLAYIRRLAAGDISEPLRGSYRGEFHDIQQELNLMGRQLTDVIVTAKTLSERVSMSSGELRSRSESMSQGSAQQAAGAEEASASMEQMAANIRQSADNAKQTEHIALQSAEYAEEGGRVVSETVATMQKISKKIAIIEDIARQTRLLSLNATIEAARAQEHGQAFSIVASEVRQLSDVTRKAAGDINELTASSLAVSEKAGEMLSTLVPSIQHTAELVQEITAANNEQNAGTTQINQAIQQLDRITQQNSSIAQEIAATAEELATQSQHLQHTIEFFKIGETAQATLRQNPPDDSKQYAQREGEEESEQTSWKGISPHSPNDNDS